MAERDLIINKVFKCYLFGSKRFGMT